MRRIIEFFIRTSKKNATRRGILIAVGLLIFFFMVECGLNIWIRSSLRRSLAADSIRSTKIVSQISWLGLGDILAGRVNRLKVNAINCSLNNLRYSRLTMESQGFRFDLTVLLREKRLAIIVMRKTRISGVIGEPALNDFLNLRYPEYQSRVRIRPGGLILFGSAHVFNKNVPVVLEGDLKTISQKRLRFYPTRLLIANSSISGSLLRIVSRQVPLEFEIMEDWPLEITDFKLEDQKIAISMDEVKT